MKTRILLIAVLFIASFMMACKNPASQTAGSPSETLKPSAGTESKEASESESEEGSGEETQDDSGTESEAETKEPETVAPSTVPEPTLPASVGKTALTTRVENYANVRSGPSTEHEIVGKIFLFCAAEILDEVEGEDGPWYLITSGNVKGYSRADLFIIGDEAEALKTDVGVLKGVVNEDWLRVRSSPDLSTLDNVFDCYERGTEIVIKEIKDGWAKIESDDASAGYVYASCLTSVRYEFKTAISLEEERIALEKKKAAEEAALRAQKEYEEKQRLAREAEEAARRAQELAAQQQAAQTAADQQALAEAARKAAEAAEANAVANADMLSAKRNALCAYALQFVGNPYVSGGRSLTNGTDCSNFTQLIYAHFDIGYLYYYPAGQATQGIEVDMANDLQPGDLLFYSNSQRYLGHVAIYIGNGQIVHAASVEAGIIVSSAYYRQPLFARRFIY